MPVADGMGESMKRASCSVALSEGVKAETCRNFRGIRQWVMCRAWSKEHEGMSFGEAIRQSWREAIDACRLAGGSPGPEDVPEMVKVARVLDRETGAEAGRIIYTESPAGKEVTVCMGGDCTTTHGDKRLYYIAQAFYDRLGYDVREEHDHKLSVPAAQAGAH